MGTPQLLEIKSYDERRFKPWELLALAAAAEARLQHPVAQAVREAALQAGIQVPECHEVQYRVGMGVEAQINGCFVHLGSPRFLRHCGIGLDRAESDLRYMDEVGQAQLMLAIDGEVQGLMPYADQVRPESRDVIRALRQAGIRDTIMLTGIQSGAVGAQLGIDRQFAGTLLADKAAVIQQSAMGAQSRDGGRRHQTAAPASDEAPKAIVGPRPSFFGPGTPLPMQPGHPSFQFGRLECPERLGGTLVWSRGHPTSREKRGEDMGAPDLFVGV